MYHLKPLFEDFDHQLTTNEDRQSLRDVAKEVARRQAYRITIKDSHDSGPREVKAGDEIRIPEPLTTAKIGRVSADGIQATIYSEQISGATVGPSTARYFDSPLVDNIKLGEYRVALILHESGEESPDLRIVAFPEYLAADRFDIKKLSRAFRDL